MAEANSANIEIKLKNVRLSYCKVFRGEARRNDKTKEIIGWNYSTNFLLDKKTDEAQIAAIKKAMISVREAKWPGAKKQFAADKKCLRDGDIQDDDGEWVEVYSGSKGQMYLSANRPVAYDPVTKKPDPNPVQVLDRSKGADGKFPRLTEGSGKVYSGAYVNAIVRIYALDGKGEYPDRINCSLEAIQWMGHGERFGAAQIDADSAFDDEGPGEADDMDDAPAPSKKSSAATDYDDI